MAQRCLKNAVFAGPSRKSGHHRPDHSQLKAPPTAPVTQGRGWIIGIGQHLLDPTDPFPAGFTVGDIWG
ncbi:MAG: proline racemase family protein [Sulfitobacter sp.]